jgi:transcriptional regulator NrdR family protein
MIKHAKEKGTLSYCPSCEKDTQCESIDSRYVSTERYRYRKKICSICGCIFWTQEYLKDHVDEAFDLKRRIKKFWEDYYSGDN